MKPVLSVELGSDPLERVRADLIVVGVAPTDRPLRGAAGYVDWRSCGRLWELVSAGKIVGIRGHASLVIPGLGFQSGSLLVLGLGPRRSLEVSAWRELGRDAAERSIGLCAETVALAIVQDVLIDRPIEDSERAEAVAALISGAAEGVLARGKGLRIVLSGISPTALDGISVPAGVEVQVSGPTFSREAPAVLQGSQISRQAPVSRNV